ncbi:hypothetical protein [Roseospira visakhapatnamensis]|uniref:Uncharacterized protein n=1 Tax=Roseospira visakhapatnamensis TaxID=390880 RepID=A0A7W6RB27_9PROT|nr:hypothetical protein [Roseospira visakhapatnamensis]MBB4265192.1 hypothetical protein [Roseospira visakhapatnamensis]
MPQTSPLSSEEEAAVTRGGQYNGLRYDPAANPYGLDGLGYQTNGPAAWNDTAAMTGAVARLTEAVAADAASSAGAVDQAAASATAAIQSATQAETQADRATGQAVRAEAAALTVDGATVPDPSPATAGMVPKVNAAGTYYEMAPQTITVAYGDRAGLRALEGPEGALALVSRLGMFQWAPGSGPPDDGEICFATTTGHWLLATTAWDMVAAYVGAEIDALASGGEDTAGAVAALSGRVLTGTAEVSVTSVSSLSHADVTGSVPGASPGDTVTASPPAGLNARLSWHAWVSASDTITLRLTNAAASHASLTAGTWNLTVFKGA